MRLIVWEGDYGLPSIDSDCLYVILYAKMTKAPLEVTFGTNPMLYYKRYPVLISGNLKLRNVHDILSHLRLRGYTLDYNLSIKHCTDASNFANTTGRRLRQIVYYSWWLDDANYQGLSASWYLKAMPFPFNHLYPRHCRKMTRRMLEAALDEHSARNHVIRLAAETFSALAAKLDNKSYFYGEKPCFLDALVFANLAPLVYVPFPSGEMLTLLKRWPLLVEYVERVRRAFFPDCKFGCKYAGGCKRDAVIGARTILLALAFACVLGAVCSRNVLHIRVVKFAC